MGILSWGRLGEGRGRFPSPAFGAGIWIHEENKKEEIRVFQSRVPRISWLPAAPGRWEVVLQWMKQFLPGQGENRLQRKGNKIK